MRSTVLAPIEPVAPRMVMLRSAEEARLSTSPIGTLLRISPHQQSARRRLEAAAHKPDQSGDDRRRRKTVEAVHQAPVTGNELARILGAEAALQHRFEDV